MLWHDDWDSTRRILTDWWRHKGTAVSVHALKEEPWEVVEPPEEPGTIEERWLNPTYRAQAAHHFLSKTWFGGAAFPYAFIDLGPGSLGTFLGSEPEFAPSTVWYKPCIGDADLDRPIVFDPQSPWLQKHLAIVDAMLELSQGRWLVGQPDLIENLDTLIQLRDAMVTLEDIVERPDWVERKIWEINDAFFAAFDLIFERIRDPWGGNSFVFDIWGPGKTCKVQCDANTMISPEAFRRLVCPALRAQCAWLDYSMFHLDGTQAVPCLDALLEIDELDAIEWTPQVQLEQGGNPRWFPMYRRILDSGKSVQAINVLPSEVEPMIDALGTDGLMMLVWCESEAEGRRLVERVYG